MVKKVKIFLLSIFATLAFCCANTSALSVISLEKTSTDSDSIELNAPSGGYQFDATFLDSNLTLEYLATIKNDEASSIKINSISLTESTYDFLEYSYYGLSIGDIIPAGDTKSFTISVKTNANEPSTVTEDYDLHINYESTIPDNPPTFADSILIFAIIFAGAAVVAIILTRKTGQRRHLAIIFMLPVALLFAGNQAGAVTPQDFHLKGKVNFTKVYTVTVDPNGGTYKESAGLTTAKVRDGQKYHVETATRDTYSFVSWEINPSEATLDTNNDIIITSDTSLKALWNEIYYQITINPNGGKYNGSESEYTASYRPHTNAPIGTPERTGYDFRGWSTSSGSTFTGNSWPMEDDVVLTATWEIKHLNVTVNPNGGKFNGSTDIYRTVIDYGNTLSLTSIEYADHEIKNWTKNVTDTLEASTQSIVITEDTDLIANWWSSIFHTVTIIPNGGTYDNSSNTSTYQVREGTTYEMKEATRTSYALDYWHYTGTSTVLNGTEFVVENDVSLTAEWVSVVARIERTGKLYSSIMKAEAEAIENDTITLLVNTEEIVTNSKKVTLDLYSHTLAGYIVNTADGNLTLINGTVDNYSIPTDTTNPTGAAVINNGTLTLGINDYTDAAMNETVPLIDNENIRLIGSEVGLEQNGAFYFYDGQIEGIVGLNGGYNGSPWYRNTYDGVVVNYFPYITHNTTKDCQHVELSNADRAVSKTIENGPIYYYNLQDNINTSILTGYKIYAVRDFDASYPITVPAGETIDFDIIGYNVNLGELATVNGTLNITDSKSENNTAGLLTTSQSIQNNGDLNLNNIQATTQTTSTVINNYGTLSLTNTTINSLRGTVINALGDSATINLDSNSSVTSTVSGSPAIENNSANLTLSGGTYSGTRCTILNNSGKTMTFESGTISGINQGVCNYGGTFTMNGGDIDLKSSGSNPVYGFSSSQTSGQMGGTININGGRITVVSRANNYAYGISQASGGTINMTGGEINVTRTPGTTSSYTIYGIQKQNNTGALNITGGKITVSGEKNTQVYGVYGSGQQVELNISGANTSIEVSNTSTTTNSNTNGIFAYGTKTTFTDASLTVNSTAGEAVGINVYNKGSAIIRGNAQISARSTSSNAYGIYRSDTNTSYPTSITMEGGSVSATTDASDKIGFGLSANTINVTGGSVYGSTYGIHGTYNSMTSTITLGTNAEPLYNGVDTDNEGNVYPATPEIKGGIYGVYTGNVYFYDGIIKGGTAYVNDQTIIKAIPDKTTRKVVNLTNPVEQDCWLEYEQDYLQLPDGSTYSSLTDAYDVVQDGETITVIRDASTPAVLPTNTKNITFDLNGHTLTYSQPLVNNGTMLITDSSTNKTGAIINDNSAASNVVENNGTLTIRDATVTGYQCVVQNNYNKNFALENGTLNATTSAVCSNKGTTTVNNGNINISRTGTGFSYGFYNSNNQEGGIINFNSGKITINVSGGQAYGIYQHLGTTNLAGGEIIVNQTGSGLVNGVYATNLNMTGGHVKATTTSDSMAYGIRIDQGSTTISGESILIEAHSDGGTYSAHGVSLKSSTGTITDATINATSASGEAYGIHEDYGSTVNINNVTITAHSDTNNAYGGGIIYNYAANPSIINMNGGSVSAATDASDKIGAGLSANTINVTSGTVYGNSYGILGQASSIVSTITLGTNAEPLYNGVNTNGEGHTYAATPEIKGGVYGINDGNVNFYDGIIKGGTAYVNDPAIIKSIPDGTSRVIADLTNPAEQDCWLEYEQDYLQLPDGSTYNSLSDAFDNVQNGETVTVIRNADTPAALPTNTKNITLDLNGHTLNYSQPLGNSGTMRITDSSVSKAGAIINNNTAADSSINNTGTLTIDTVTITGHQCTVKNNGGGTFTLESGTINGSISTICNYGSTFTMNGGSVVTTATGLNTYGIYTPQTASGGTITINGGTIRYDYTGTSSAYAIYQYNGNMNISGGEIIASTDTTYASNNLYGIWKQYGTLNITGGHIKTTANGGISNGIYSAQGTLNISGASTIIESISTSTNDVYTIQPARSTLTISDATVKAEGTAGAAYVIYTSSSATTNIHAGATITAHSTNNNAYGIEHLYTGSLTTTNVDGGTITAIADSADKLGVGINDYTVNMTGGTVYGSSYGISGTCYNQTATITLGTNAAPLYNGIATDGESHIYPATPEIRGDVYGIEGGIVNFYDGIIKGGVKAYDGNNIKQIADNTYIYGGSETIDGTEYKTSYLSVEKVLAKIGDDEYYTLQAAINAANEDDEIDLVADNNIFAAINIPAGKKFSIDFNGYEVVTGSQFVNNGNVTLFDSTGNAKAIDYREANDLFANNANASLTIDGIDLQARYAIDNKANGTVTLRNLAIGETDASEIAIENRGSLTADNITARATHRVLYSNGGNINVDNSTFTATMPNENNIRYGVFAENGTTGSINHSLINGYGDAGKDGSLYRPAYYQTGNSTNISMTGTTVNGYTRIEGGTFSMTDGALARDTSSTYHRPTLYNRGTATVTNTPISLTQIGTNSAEQYATAVVNTGTLTIDSSVVTHNLASSAAGTTARIIHNNAGTLNFINSSISHTCRNANNQIVDNGTTYGIFTTGNMHYENSTVSLSRATLYNIFVDGGTVDMASGTVIANSSSNAYALWIKSGALTLGEAESTSSVNYGTENANVSTTLPDIQAYGSSYGNGVVLIGGSFNYYDGKITQSSTIGPAVQGDRVTKATVTNVEYLYQPEAHTDENGHTYFVLEFMRN